MWGRATRTDPEVAERVRAVATILDGLGHHIEEIADQSICDWQALWSAYCVNWVGGRAQFATTAKERGRAPERLQDYLGPMTYRHYLVAERYDKFDIWKMMERFDVLLVPTMAIRVPEANGPYSLLREEELEPWLARLCDACRYTMPANETGLPGISVPAGLDGDGLPIGVQLYGNFCREDVLLQLAAQVERAHPE
jgi:amidase